MECWGKSQSWAFRLVFFTTAPLYLISSSQEFWPAKCLPGEKLAFSATEAFVKVATHVTFQLALLGKDK
jgi:hypothetical protein